MKLNKICRLMAAFALPVLTLACGENYIDAPDFDKTDKGLKESIDSVSSWNRCTYTYNDNVVELSKEQQTFLKSINNYILPDQDYLYFRSDTPESMIPEEGKILVIPVGSPLAPCGFMGRVAYREDDSFGKCVYFLDVDNVDVFKTLDMDIRLNAEQLANTECLAYTLGEEAFEYIDDTQFFEGAPTCGLQYQIDNLDGNAPNATALPRANENDKSDEEKSDKDDKPKVAISLKPIGNGWVGEISITTNKGTNGKEYPIDAELSGSITVRPLYMNPRKYIDEYGDYVEVIDEATTLTLNLSDKLKAELKKIGKYDLCLRTPTFKRDIPVPNCPVPITVRYMLEVGLLGNIETSFGFSNTFTVRTHTEYHNYELVKEVCESDFDLFKNTTFDFDRIKIEGGIYFKSYLGFAPKGFKGTALVENKLTLAANVTWPGENLLKLEPKASVDLNTKLQVHSFKKEDSWYKPAGLNLSVKAHPKSWEVSIFPHCDDLTALRFKNDTKAEITYRTDPWFLLWLASHEFEMVVVTDGWLRDENPAYIHSTYKPVLTGQQSSKYYYKVDVTNLDPATNYYGVPVYTLWGVRMYGNPFPLSDTRKMLGAIGLGRNFITFKYSPYGLMTKIDNRLDESKTTITWEDNKPKAIKIVDYEYDDNNIYVPTGDVSYISNIKTDEKTGVLLSCRWYEDGDYGNVKLYYDDQYHLTGLTDHATDGSTATSIRWDSEGRLMSIHISGDGETTDITYGYSGKGVENKLNQWTYGTAMALSFLSFPRLAGKAPAYLPTSITIKDSYDGRTETTSLRFKYEFNDDGSIQYEKVNDEGIWVDLPYAYRNVGVSEEVLNRDETLGYSRSSDGNTILKRHMRKFRVFGPKSK